jgi:hypothetical protein
MRIAMFALLVACLVSGCASFIAASGTDLRALVAREEIHQVLGKPTADHHEDSKPSEEFWYRGKLAEESMVAPATCCFVPVQLPIELCHLVHCCVWGQKVVILYDQTGRPYLGYAGDSRLCYGPSRGEPK